MPLCLAAATASLAFAVPQLDCADRDPVPLTILDGLLSNPNAGMFGQIKLSGDLLVAGLPREWAPVGGVKGAVYIHRRGPDGSWLVPDRIHPTAIDDAGRFVGAPSKIDFTVANGTVFLPIEASAGKKIVAMEFQDGAWTESARFGGEPGWNYTHSTDFGGYGRSMWLAADGDRLVVGAPHAMLPTAQVPGIIQTFEKDASGQWQSISVMGDAGPLFAGDRLADLEGDRLAVIRHGSFITPTTAHAAVLEFDGSVWTEVYRSAEVSSPNSLALDGPRVLAGSFYGYADIFDTTTAGAQSTGGAPIQVIGDPSRRHLVPGTDDYNPPYFCDIEASDDLAVIGFRDNHFGAETVDTYEWFEGSYRLTSKTRAPACAADVALDNGIAAWIGPVTTNGSGGIAVPRFETWRIDDARAFPACEGAADLVVSGSGVSPFNGGVVTGYQLPVGSTLTVFGGLAFGSTPVAQGAELCIAEPGLTRLGAPVLTDMNGRARFSSAALNLTELGASTLPGGSFFLQGVYREAPSVGGSLRVTNAVRLTLCE